MPVPISLLEAFGVLPDPRLERGKEHRWSELLVIAVCTMLTGGESFYDIEDFAREREPWLRTFLALPGGPPSDDTFDRLFQALDPVAFAETFTFRTQSLRSALPEAQREIVAVDGKAARRALNAGEDVRYLVSAWATENGLALVQVADKANEITAVPALLRALELTGCVVTADALHCQRNTAKEIREADADYVLALKGNQGTAHQEIKDALDDAIARADPQLATLETIEKGHGRIETRRYWQSTDLGWFTDRANWEGLQSVGVVEAIREINGKASSERRYYPPAQGSGVLAGEHVLQALAQHHRASEFGIVTGELSSPGRLLGGVRPHVAAQRPEGPGEFGSLAPQVLAHVIESLAGRLHEVEVIKDDARLGQKQAHTLHKSRAHAHGDQLDLRGCSAVGAQFRHEGRHAFRLTSLGHEEQQGAGPHPRHW